MYDDLSEDETVRQELEKRLLHVRTELEALDNYVTGLGRRR